MVSIYQHQLLSLRVTDCHVSGHTVLVPYGKLDADSLLAAYEESQPCEKGQPKTRLQLQLRRAARCGQPNMLDDIPVYAHVRVRILPGYHRISFPGCSQSLT